MNTIINVKDLLESCQQLQRCVHQSRKAMKVSLQGVWQAGGFCLMRFPASRSWHVQKQRESP